MPATNPYGLQDKPWRFVQEYLTDLNGSAAYQRAGYKARGNVAEANASRLLRNAKVSAAVQAEKERLAAEQGLTRNTVIHGWRKMERADIRDLFEWDAQGQVTVKPSSQISDDLAYAISEVTQVITAQGTRLHFKLTEKKGVLDSIAKHLRMFEDDDAQPPDIHVHVHTARDRVTSRVQSLAIRHAEHAINGR